MRSGPGEIRRIQKATGITTVFVTHDQEEAMSISDLIVVMNAAWYSKSASLRRLILRESFL